MPASANRSAQGLTQLRAGGASPRSPAQLALSPTSLLTPPTTPGLLSRRGSVDGAASPPQSYLQSRRGSFTAAAQQLGGLVAGAGSAGKEHAAKAATRMGLGGRKRGQSHRGTQPLQVDCRPGDEIPEGTKKQLGIRLMNMKSVDERHDALKLDMDQEVRGMLADKERGYRARLGHRDEGSADQHDEPGWIKFSHVLGEKKDKAVVVTEKFLHVLSKKKGQPGKCIAGGFCATPECTFELSCLASIIESPNKAPRTVCLDFRRPTRKKQNEPAAPPAAVPAEEEQSTRYSVLSDLADPTVLLFNFPPDRSEPQGDGAAQPGDKGAENDGGDDVFGAGKWSFIAVLRKQVPAPNAIILRHPGGLRTADDVQRAVSRAVTKDLMKELSTGIPQDGEQEGHRLVDLMDASRDDTMGLAQKGDLVKTFRAHQAKKLLYSHKVELLRRSGQLKANRIIAITDTRLYFLDTESKHFHCYRDIDLANVQAVMHEDRGQDAVVLIQVDIANDKSKKYPTDVLFRIRRKARDPLIAAISTAYETCMFNQLTVTPTDSLEKKKRGRVEVIMKRHFGGERKQAVAAGKEDATGWLAWILRNERVEFLKILTQVIPQDDINFMARSLVDLCEADGITRSLVHDAVRVEMELATDTATIFRGRSLPAAVLNVYGGASADDFVKLLFLPVLKKFGNTDVTKVDELFRKAYPQGDPDGQIGLRTRSQAEKEYEAEAKKLCNWCDQFFEHIVEQDVPPEVKSIVRMIDEVSKERGIPPNPLIGGYLMLRLFSPAVSNPGGTFGSQLQRAPQLSYLTISRVLQNTANGTYMKDRQEPGTARAVNWWIERRHRRQEWATFKAQHCPPGWAQDHEQFRSWFRDGVCEPGPRTTWSEYIERVISDEVTQPGSPAAAPEGDERRNFPQQLDGAAVAAEPADFVAMIEQQLAEPDYIMPFDPKVLSAVHRAISSYTEKMLCVLWTDLTVARIKKEHLEEERKQAEGGGSDLDLSVHSEESPAVSPRYNFGAAGFAKGFTFGDDGSNPGSESLQAQDRRMSESADRAPALLSFAPAHGVLAGASGAGAAEPASPPASPHRKRASQFWRRASLAFPAQIAARQSAAEKARRISLKREEKRKKKPKERKHSRESVPKVASLMDTSTSLVASPGAPRLLSPRCNFNRSVSLLGSVRSGAVDNSQEEYAASLRRLLVEQTRELRRLAQDEAGLAAVLATQRLRLECPDVWDAL
eukprot:TRINITY_DN12836_c0_g1_i1.p1 TRINITY_DN12836_c0_g1~~TRINITY_DN12836_c0_g1_i1.p1  ORF type:complete len:1226 (+),score=382.58 TRINITY_DN12836_c0_g1_i1:98-3775(+)